MTSAVATAVASVTASTGNSGYGSGESSQQQQSTGSTGEHTGHDMLPDPEELMVINNVSGGWPVGYRGAHGGFSPPGGSSSGA